MFPILFRIGSFPIHSYGVMLVIAFFVGIAIAAKRSGRFGITKDQINDVALGVVISGILGARITYIVLNPSQFRQPSELFSLQFQGLTSFGGLVFGVGYLVFYAKRKHVDLIGLFDSFAPGYLVAHAIGRVGCLLNGCCYGRVTNMGFPLGVPIAPNNPELHQPAQIYDSLMVLAGCGLLLLLERRGWRKGQAYCAGLVVYAVSRFIYEYWRDPENAPPLVGTPVTEAQAAAIVITLVGVIGFIIYGRKRSPREAMA
jgi:phosphatidylglycerol:prolipoprotein diacylglycerol transferase